MFWITKYKHNKITAEYQKEIDDLKKTLNRRDDIVEILDRITKKESSPYLMADDGWVTSSGVMDSLDETIPRYVEDYFGGRVIKQESTPVTVLDANGKAIYGVTAKKPKEGENFILHLIK